MMKRLLLFIFGNIAFVSLVVIVCMLGVELIITRNAIDGNVVIIELVAICLLPVVHKLAVIGDKK